MTIAVSACTQGGVTPEVADAGTVAGSSTVPVNAAPTTVATANAAPTLPLPTVDAPTTTSQVTTTTTLASAPPTIADQFAAALAPVQVTVLGAPIPASARDSVARLWLLVGRPPTGTELTTAVTAAVRDGVPLDALATLLLHSPEAVESPDAPPAQFVAGLYDAM
ncbi:MAG TPA: hypothetical protein VL916_14820, partial [Ilumatobacteraceae bacterium]|nr:hypothetical protein [Ilumatobacteraceae bacterium]